jgi:hypothetical protein
MWWNIVLFDVVMWQNVLLRAVMWQNVLLRAVITWRNVLSRAVVMWENVLLIRWRLYSSSLDTATPKHGFQQDTLCCRQPTAGRKASLCTLGTNWALFRGNRNMFIGNDSHIYRNVIQQLRHRLTVGWNRWCRSCSEQLSERRKILAALVTRRPRLHSNRRFGRV